MQIIWDNLAEVKTYIDMVGLAKLCKNEEEWGGLGVVITGRDIRRDNKSLTLDSYTERNSDYVIVTPSYKELSWLFRNTYRYIEKGTMNLEQYEDTFWAACTGFFLMHKTYKAKALLFFVIDFLASVDRRLDCQMNEIVESRKELKD